MREFFHYLVLSTSPDSHLTHIGTWIKPWLTSKVWLVICTRRKMQSPTSLDENQKTLFGQEKCQKWDLLLIDHLKFLRTPLDRSCHRVCFQGSPKLSKDYPRIRANAIFITKSHKSRFNTELHNWQRAVNIEVSPEQVWSDFNGNGKSHFSVGGLCQESDAVVTFEPSGEDFHLGGNREWFSQVSFVFNTQQD